MEKEIVWTAIAQKDFWNIIIYLEERWPAGVLDKFQKKLKLKLDLIKLQPNIGYKSSKYSRFRQTIISRHYILIYSVKKTHIVVLRLKHMRMK